MPTGGQILLERLRGWGKWRSALALAILVALGGTVTAQPLPPLRVAVYDAPPYGHAAPNGSVSGLSVDLWRRVAERMERQFELTPVSDMAALLAGVHQGRFDVAIGAITITPEREKLVDFSYPSHRSGVAVALRKSTGPLAALRAYFAALTELGSLVVLILAALVVTGLVMWRIERAGTLAGHESHVTTLRDGIYWAVVTMTTVGYGDKTPKTTSGRVVATAWMFASLVLISLLSTSLVSKLTADRVEGGNSATSVDLSRHKLAAVANSSGAEFLAEQHLAFSETKTLSEALDRLEAGRATAVVNSVGALTYLIDTSHARGIEVAAGLLAPAYLAFAFPPGSALRKPVDEALIEITSTPEWVRLEQRFL